MAAQRTSGTRSLVEDLHGKIQLPSIWVTLDNGRFVASSKHSHTDVSPRSFFVLEDHARTAADAIAAFINSLVRRQLDCNADVFVCLFSSFAVQEKTPMPKPEPVPQHILDQISRGEHHHHDHHHDHHHHHDHGHDHGMGMGKFGL